MNCPKTISQIFPRLDCIYLDSAATTLTPQCVIDAMNRYFSEQEGTVHRAVYSYAQEATALYLEAREAVADFINSKEEIIFTRGTTASLNLLARSLTPKKVVVTETEHHSNIVPWQLVGAQVVPIPVNDAGELILDNLDELLEGADLLSVAHVCNVTGTVHPVEELAKRAHAHDIPIAVDGAQAVGHIPVDVSNFDFYAFSGHKMYGPTGIGVLHGKRSLLEQMPPVEGGGDMIESV
ncbi:MAG: aminotransferase class V-fold PLP-dependent enzyme, partial [Chlamydiae bacterium]|nr:aminotransferase class V-fold PLP-dependent enzyme [Chlamydiota bacterium]